MYEGPAPSGPGSKAAAAVRKRSYAPPPSPIVTLGFPVLILLGVVFYVRLQPEGSALPSVLQHFGGLRDRVLDLAEQSRARFFASEGPSPADGRPKEGEKRSRTPRRPKPVLNVVASTAPLKNQVTLHLANGNRLTGELIREAPDQVIVLWGGGEVTFNPSEIKEIVRHPDPAAPAP